VPLAARLGFDGIQRELAEIAVSVLVRTSAF